MSDFADWPWRSDVVWAAELTVDGVVVRANAALAARPGEALADRVVPEQREAVRRRIAAAGGDWTAARVAVLDPRDGTVSDRSLYLRRADDRVLAVAEPSAAEHERLARRLLELNDELLDQQRRLQREHAAAQASVERLRRLEAVATAGLHGATLDEVLGEVLAAISAVVRADRAAILLLDADGRELAVRASVGEGPALDAKLEDLRGPFRRGALAGVPLLSAGEAIGILHVVAAQPEVLGEADFGLLQAAADRAALAIARAQVYEREHRIAETLQRSLLPAELPEVAGLRLAARFEPGTGLEVGGDWYDAMPLPSGDLALVIGDVAGKGVRAAAFMGEVRSTLRAYALDLDDPRAVLRAADRVVQRSRRMVTCAVSMLSPATGALRLASAGHPPALLVGAGGAHFVEDGRRGPLLAYEPGEEGRATLEPSARLVLYTDGLVERRGEALDAGLERLRTAAQRARGADLDTFCDELVAVVPGSEGPRDDIALLVVERSV